MEGKSHKLEKTVKLQFLGIFQSSVSKYVILIQMLKKCAIMIYGGSKQGCVLDLEHKNQR